MESLSINRVFSVPEDYTLEQLKKSYIEIIENLYKSNKNQIEKDLLVNQYKYMYKLGTQQYWEKQSIDADIEFPNNLLTHSNYSFGHNGNDELDLFDRFENMQENSFGYSNRIRRTYNPFSIFDNVFRNIETNCYSNSNSNVYSYSNSYSSNTNSDGSQTIIDRKYESTNGDNKHTINAYKKMPDGKITPLTEDEMKPLDKFSNIQIKN